MLERPDNANQFDVLGDVLETLRFRGSIFFRSELASPWGVNFASAEGVPRFHIGMNGEFSVGLSQRGSTRVKTREIVMLPNGGEHWIADHNDSQRKTSEVMGQACELGTPLFQDGEITHRVMCGLVRFDQDAPHPILHALPDIMHFPELPEDSPIWRLVQLIDQQVEQSQRQSSPIVDRLTEALFLYLLDHFGRSQKHPTGFLGALHDRRIHHALALIHQDPSHDWTLNALGDRVGMSRSTLVRHFQEAIGVAPMTYLANWRLTKAHNLVKHTRTPIAVIADTVGFASASTLNKAFQRHYGYTPKKLRSSKTK